MNPVVEVAQGKLSGRTVAGVSAFKGIPYAAPPFGAHRFQAPQQPESWEGVRQAAEFGPTAPKPGFPSPIDQILSEVAIDGDDCLNLNVWTPDVEASGLPVLVWIHGGSFTNGSGAVPTYDGTAFARDGIVCVTINYRLGVDGFLAIDGAPANRGLLDQVAALEWVAANIAAFGGDPAQVTVAGESAGAMSVGTLLSMPRAKGLFSRAILQSGGGHHVLTEETAKKVTAALASDLGVEPTVDGFGSVPVADLTAAQTALSNRIAKQPDPRLWGELVLNVMAYEPHIDGDVVPARPIDAIAAGSTADVEIMVGSNSDEHALFFVPSGVFRHIDENLLRMAMAGMGADADRVLELYRADTPDATAGEVMMAAMTDWFFRIPVIRIAEARSGSATYMYEFAWPSPSYEGKLGACHAIEIPFVFDNLAEGTGGLLLGPNPPQKLADRTHRAWVDFVTAGDPGWAPYGSERTVMTFDEDSASVQDPRAAQRELWDKIR
ncbi:carboxylesterase/lipase family protein [Rhodococcoides fascians]|uniref:carboxylesterase/lipase family protein n=1 Tax=Rhodococcoides fascians TaxID=1828 RepID=UPI00050CEA71|nr:carboxylesterase/lipase family protein [Rhodococcus fascians]